MMIFCYNLLQLLLFPLLLPAIVVIILLRKKYRKRILPRLGFTLNRQLPSERERGKRPVFWIHALSTGETTSIIPLVRKIRNVMPDACIIFSTTSNSGQQIAKTLYPDDIDSLIYSPIDILPVVHFFINKIQPDCFLLVETDFWPNLLYSLNRNGIPSILVNGRVSDDALQGYKKMAFFFRSMFAWLDALCLQGEADREKFAEFGIKKEKLHTLGNLKFAAQPAIEPALYREIESLLPYAQGPRMCLLAGSTHPGEEEIIIEALCSLQQHFPSLCLIIAPRDPSRATALKRYCAEKGFAASLRTTKKNLPPGGVLLLDTIGELAACYQLADIAFIGGSLVDERGHNPVEPALFGCPVLFGPSMEDFSEIATELLHTGGAFQVRNGSELTAILRSLLQSPAMRNKAGTAAKKCITQQQGGVDRHLQLIRSLLLQKRGKKV